MDVFRCVFVPLAAGAFGSTWIGTEPTFCSRLMCESSKVLVLSNPTI